MLSGLGTLRLVAEVDKDEVVCAPEICGEDSRVEWEGEGGCFGEL